MKTLINWETLLVGTIFGNKNPYPGEGNLLYIKQEGDFVLLIHLGHSKNENLNGLLEYKSKEQLEESYNLEGQFILP